MKKLFVSLVTMTLLFFGNLAFAQEIPPASVTISGSPVSTLPSQTDTATISICPGPPFCSSIVAITQQSSSAPNTAASVPAEKRVYVQPHWVDGGYGVQVLQPGYRTVPKKAGEH